MNLLSSTYSTVLQVKCVPINRAQLYVVRYERRTKLNGHITHAKWIVDIVEIIRCVQNQMHRTKKL